MAILALFLLIYKWKACPRQRADIDKQHECGNSRKYHPADTATALAEDHSAAASYSSAQNSQNRWARPDAVYSAKHTIKL